LLIAIAPLENDKRRHVGALAGWVMGVGKPLIGADMHSAEPKTRPIQSAVDIYYNTTIYCQVLKKPQDIAIF
jgi:hypothetical protein